MARTRGGSSEIPHRVRRNSAACFSESLYVDRLRFHLNPLRFSSASCLVYNFCLWEHLNRSSGATHNLEAAKSCPGLTFRALVGACHREDPMGKSQLDAGDAYLKYLQVIRVVGFMNQRLEIPKDIDPDWNS